MEIYKAPDYRLITVSYNKIFSSNLTDHTIFHCFMYLYVKLSSKLGVNIFLATRLNFLNYRFLNATLSSRHLLWSAPLSILSFLSFCTINSLLNIINYWTNSIVMLLTFVYPSISAWVYYNLHDSSSLSAVVNDDDDNNDVWLITINILFYSFCHQNTYSIFIFSC